MAYEALYRRYRPSTFGDVAGQSHVVSSLRNAVAGDRVGHAYLFSGPRGTGKTTSARILAKALNCTDLAGGEPCDACDSCEQFKTSSSYDLHELDAASNNGVDAMRDLIGKVALGSPGRTKVYILDEVHMLSSGAENALLKTLEEPPPHVVFVLCTTEPNKVVPTIRSRTQHLEFSLLSSAEVGGLIDYVAGDAGLSITDDDRTYVIRAGGGSARDSLSALDQVVAAGGAPKVGHHLDALLGGLADRDTAAVLLALDGAIQAGRDPATVATSVLTDLRGAFLASMSADVDHLPESERTAAHARARSMSAGQITRAIEVIGTSIVDMRDAPDPRVDLEVALVRLTRPDLDVTPEALVERIERLEAGGIAGNPAGGPVGGAASGAAQAAAVVVSSDPGDGGFAAPPAADSSTQRAAESVPESAGVPADQAPHASTNQRPQPQPSEQPQQQPPAAQPATGGGAPTGADIARQALARQQTSKTGGGLPSQPPQAAQAAGPETGAAADAIAPVVPIGGGRSMADVRRERREASEADAATTSEFAANTEPGASSDPASASMSAAVPVQAGPEGVAAVDAVVDHAQQPDQPVADGLAPVAQLPGSHPNDAPAATNVQPTATPNEPTPASDASAEPTQLPSLSALETAWVEGMLTSLSGKVRSRFIAGQFVSVSDSAAQFGLPNPVHRDRCEEVRAEVDDVLAKHFGRPVPLELIVHALDVEPDIFAAPSAHAASEPAIVEDEPAIDPDELTDAPDVGKTVVERVLDTFEGSTVLDD